MGPKRRAITSPHGRKKCPFHRPPSTNGQAPPTQPTHGQEHPTEADITALTTLAIVACHEDPDVFGQRIRRMMSLKPSASVAPKLLTRTMLMSQFEEAMAYYQRLQAQLTRPTEVTDGTASEEKPASIPAQPPTEEKPPVVPFASSSASVPAEGPPAEAGPGQPPASEGYATREEMAALKRLAAQVGPEAAEDLADVLDHAPKGLVPDLYRRIEARLQARFNSTKTAAVA